VRAGTITALLSALWTLAALVVVCPVAHAHPLVERGVERYYHADMRAAERSFPFRDASRVKSKPSGTT